MIRAAAEGVRVPGDEEDGLVHVGYVQHWFWEPRVRGGAVDLDRRGEDDGVFPAKLFIFIFLGRHLEGFVARARAERVRHPRALDERLGQRVGTRGAHDALGYPRASFLDRGRVYRLPALGCFLVWREEFRDVVGEVLEGRDDVLVPRVLDVAVVILEALVVRSRGSVGVVVGIVRARDRQGEKPRPEDRGA